MTLTNTPEITVNGHLITAADIDAQTQYHPAASRREAMISAVESLIIAELLAQKAKLKGLSTRADRNLVDEEPGIIDKLIESEAQIPTATEEECQRYFHANSTRFISSPLVEASHILLAADPKDLEHRAQMLTLANELIQQLNTHQHSFAELARKYSVCPSKEVGGSLGQLSNGQTVSEFERQVFAASEGLMPTPVESRYGYHIVKVARKVAGDPLPYDMVKDKIQTYLNDKAHRKAISQYLHRIIDEADIQGFQFNIDDSQLMQ